MYWNRGLCTECPYQTIGFQQMYWNRVLTLLIDVRTGIGFQNVIIICIAYIYRTLSQCLYLQFWNPISVHLLAMLEPYSNTLEPCPNVYMCLHFRKLTVQLHSKMFYGHLDWIFSKKKLHQKKYSNLPNESYLETLSSSSMASSLPQLTTWSLHFWKRMRGTPSHQWLQHYNEYNSSKRISMQLEHHFWSKCHLFTDSIADSRPSMCMYNNCCHLY